LDPVRLVEAKRVALTSLDLEHTALLGDTIQAIAREKIAAAPAGAMLFVGESCSPHREMISTFAQSLGVRAVFTKSNAGAPLAGAFQRENAALALALARDLVPLKDEEVTHGFAATRWPGRLEVIEESPLTIIDVGHTPAGVRAALAGFAVMKGERTGVLVCGASGDKDAAALVSVLAPAFDAIICAAARHKGTPASQIAAHAAAANPRAEIVIAESVTDARRLARHRADGNDAAIYVAGGLFLAAEYRAVSIGRDPSTLVFF
jgi:dihydrofolate synthase/folylpolyglutamate synthase